MKSKTTLLVPIAKPRNALVAHSHQRSGAGAHFKSSKALRARDISSLRREMAAA